MKYVDPRMRINPNPRKTRGSSFLGWIPGLDLDTFD
jgi:hypothetical protein